MVPYFIFAPIAVGVEVLKRALLQRESLNLKLAARGIFLNMDYQNLNQHYGLVLWFLPSLFIAKFLLYSMNLKVKNRIVQSVLVLILFFLSFRIELPFAIDNGMNVLPWVWMGIVFYYYFRNQTVSWVFVVVPLAGCFISVSPLDLANKFYPNVILNSAWAISWIFTLTLFCQRLKLPVQLESLISLWGKETMLLFVFHPYTNNIAHLLAERINSSLWGLKFLFSVLMLQVLILIKTKNPRRWIFSYV